MNYLQRNRGFAIVAAIFLLVILSALATFIVSVSTGQHIGQAMDVEGERAFQAANAGMDWARFRIAATNACPANSNWGATNTSFGFVGTATLGSYVATVECRVPEPATTVGAVATTVFEVRVTACNKPQAAEPRCPGVVNTFGYVERQMIGLLGL